jgi:hypothetical protein
LRCREQRRGDRQPVGGENLKQGKGDGKSSDCPGRSGANGLRDFRAVLSNDVDRSGEQCWIPVTAGARDEVDELPPADRAVTRGIRRLR